MNRKSGLTRRSFVKVLGATALGAPWAVRGVRAVSPNDKLNVALVGAGGRGSYISLEALCATAGWRARGTTAAFCGGRTSEESYVRGSGADRFPHSRASRRRHVLAGHKAAAYDSQR